MGAPQPVVGEAAVYAEAVRVFRQRIEALQVPFDTIEAVAGFPQRYVNTLLSGGKTMSVFSFFTLASALGLTVTFTHDEEKLARLQQRADWIPVRRTGARYRPRVRAKKHAISVAFKLYPDLLRKRAAEGGYARAAKMTERQRIRSARHAAQARWHNGNGPVK